MSEIRTSKTHPIEIDWLDALPVGLTLAPGVRDKSSYGHFWRRDLDADLAALHAKGATALACLLEDHELAQYEIEALVPKAEAAGLRVLRLPIVDTRVPTSLDAVEPLLDEIEAIVAAGGRVVIHCRGGLGRTGTIAGCYLARRGYGYNEAFAMLLRVRGPRCPENPAQRGFIQRYIERRAAQAAGATQGGETP